MEKSTNTIFEVGFCLADWSLSLKPRWKMKNAIIWSRSHTWVIIWMDHLVSFKVHSEKQASECQIIKTENGMWELCAKVLKKFTSHTTNGRHISWINVRMKSLKPLGMERLGEKSWFQSWFPKQREEREEER